MTHRTYSAKIIHKSAKGSFPAMRGYIIEGDTAIGVFNRHTTRDGFVPPFTYKFYSGAARDRFASFSDSLSVEETIEAILP